MEDNSKPEVVTDTQQEQTSAPQVTFRHDSYSSDRNGGGKKGIIFAFIALAVLVIGIGIYFFVTNKSKGSVEGDNTSADENSLVITDPEPFEEETPAPTATATVTPLASPLSELSRSGVTIQVQNGTGIPKEAAFLQEALTKLGYKDVKTGNAPSTDFTKTVVTFSTSVKEPVVLDITTKLKEIYQTVESKTASSTSFDVVVVTGTRKGTTPKPSSL